MRRAFLIAAALTAASTAAVSAHASGGVTLTEAKGPKFPTRTFVLELPSTRKLSIGDIRVSENGSSVVSPTLVSAANAGRRTFGVVLVIDSSDSMAGKPIAGAMAAARAFASQRNPRQQLALVTFNGKPEVKLPFTSDDAQINEALSAVPSVSYGTHIYDAVEQAELLLQQAKIQSGSILVLSDGADTGSTHTLQQVAQVARVNHIKLFAVGLKSARFNPKTLTALAAAGGGQYGAAASTSELTPLFDQLGQRLSQEYVLQYKSLAGPGQKVSVHVEVPGSGAAGTAYQTPKLKIPTVPPFHRSLGTRITTSPIFMVLLALVIAGGLSLLLIASLQPKRTDLPRRMSEFVSVPGLQTHERHGAPTTEEIIAAPRPGPWARFQQALEIAEIHASAEAIVFGTIIGTALAFLFFDVAFGSPWWMLFALLVPIGVREWVVRTLARRRKRFAEQLPDALQVISSALRSGHSFAGALAVVVESASEPMKSEMHRVVADEQLGVPLDSSIAVVCDRMASNDLEQVALVAELPRESGGNAAEVSDRVAETIRERFELRRLISTLTVQGRMSRWIVSGLPVVIILILQVINPHYLHPLVASTGGKVVLALAAALVVAGSFVIKKIVDIKV